VCGRYSFGKTDRIDWVRFGVPPVPDLFPRWNIGPGSMVLAVREGRETAASIATAATHARRGAKAGAAFIHSREVADLRWGLIPGWSRDASVGNRLANARAESAHEKPSFRNAFEARRCVLPACGFYEWQGVAGQKRKQPWRIEPAAGGFFSLGALWERWHGPDGDERETCTILTVPASRALAHIHDRMPVLIDDADLGDWLSHATPLERARALCVSGPDDRCVAWCVSMAINAPANNDPSVAAPLA
jgi:putative SOS response-associated peptidase YedK